jgi:hypothetical protein
MNTGYFNDDNGKKSLGRLEYFIACRFANAVILTGILIAFLEIFSVSKTSIGLPVISAGGVLYGIAMGARGWMRQAEATMASSPNSTYGTGMTSLPGASVVQQSTTVTQTSIPGNPTMISNPGVPVVKFPDPKSL